MLITPPVDGGGGGSLMPQWRDDLSNQRNSERRHKAFTNPNGEAPTMPTTVTSIPAMLD